MKEIWEDTDGNIDIFVAGVGTGAITGVATALKPRKPDLKAVAVEPISSPQYLEATRTTQNPRNRAGFIPGNLDTELIDEVMQIDHEEAGEMARQLAEEGILCGISAGGNVYAAVEQAKRPENEGKLIVTIVCDQAKDTCLLGYLKRNNKIYYN